MHAPLRSLIGPFALAFATSLALSFPVATARADDAPAIAMVLEAGGTRIDPERVRLGVARELGMPVVSILETPRRATIGVLAIAVTERGRRAAIRFLPNDGVRYAVMLDVRGAGRIDPLGSWLVTPCASIVRSSNERRAAQEPTHEALDPWIAAHAAPESSSGEPHTTLDPWLGTPRSPPRVWVTDVHVAEEIEDPWASALTRYRDEQTTRLAPPSRPR